MRKRRDPIRQEGAERAGPWILCRVRPDGTEHPAGAGVEYDGFAVLVGGDDAVVNAVEDRFQEVRPASQSVDGPVQSALGLSIRAFPLVQGEGRPDVQVQLPFLERLQHVAEGTGGLGPLPPGLFGVADEIDHRNVQRASDASSDLDAVQIAFGIEVDQSKVGARCRGFFEGLLHGRNSGADRMAQLPQARFEGGGVRVAALDDQYPGVGHATAQQGGIAEPEGVPLPSQSINRRGPAVNLDIRGHMV